MVEILQSTCKDSCDSELSATLPKISDFIIHFSRSALNYIHIIKRVNLSKLLTKMKLTYHEMAFCSQELTG